MPIVNYVWDVVSDNVLMEMDDEGNTLARYVQEPALHGEAISQERDGQVRYYDYDGLGNTSELTDENQDVTDTYEYTAFGEEVERTGTTENPFGYKGALGYYSDVETGEVYIAPKIYQPLIARFLSPTPITAANALNPFAIALFNADDIANEDDSPISMYVGRMGIRVDAWFCGDTAYTNFGFFLSKRAPCKGYFVQKIDAWCIKDDTCINCPDAPSFNFRTPPDLTYYEAFPVEKDRPPWVEGQPVHTTLDTSSAVLEKDTCGYDVVIGEIRFYCESTTGDLSNKPPWVKNAFWSGGGCHKGTGDIPSRQGLPDFWKIKPLASGSRGTLAEWNCCGCWMIDYKWFIDPPHPKFNY